MMFEDDYRFKEWMNVACLRIVVFGILLRIRLISSASMDIGNPLSVFSGSGIRYPQILGRCDRSERWTKGGQDSIS